MRPFDQLDWVHRFEDNYEMVMYLQLENTDSDGIYMQVLMKVDEQGAESWQILYNRRLTSVIGDVAVDRNHDSYEDEVLRQYLRSHPTLVEDEKEYFQAWLREQSGGGNNGEKKADESESQRDG